jgi:hypothetical protein
LLKNDQEILHTIKEKHESLRDVYDMRQYYIKRNGGGGRNNGKSTLSPTFANNTPTTETTAKLKNAFIPNTQRDQLYKTLLSFPDVAPQKTIQPPLCANLETLL